MPSVGFVANGVVDETSDDVTPPSVLMEHPPLAVFVNGNFYSPNGAHLFFCFCSPYTLSECIFW
jgi:hypothetical protein